MNKNEKPHLKQGASTLDVVAIGVGSAIGVSIFSVMTPVAQVAGSGALISLCIAALPMFAFAFVYAFMTSAVPVSGASFAWPARFISPFAGFIVSWLRILGSTGAIIQTGVVLVNYLESGLGMSIPVNLTMALFFTVFYILNLRGIAFAAAAQLGLTLLLIAILVGISAAGVTSLNPAQVVSVGDAGWSGIITAVPIMVGLFIGVEFAAEIGEEVRDGRKAIARGIAISVLTVLFLYAAITAVAFGLLGSDALAQSKAPLLGITALLFGDYSNLVMLVAVVAALTTTLNGTMMIFSRYLFAMSRERALPSFLALVHPRWGTPHIALTCVYLLSLAGLLMPKNLIFLFLAVNIPTMLKYAASCLSCLLLVRRHPDLYQAAAIRPPRPLLRAGAVVGMLCAFGIVAAGLGADWRPYLLLLGWAGAGLAVWYLRRK